MSKKYLGDMTLLSSLEDYKNLNLKQGKTEIWEDGMRTSGAENTYEWWYVDAEFENGIVIVSTHFTKDGFDAPGPAHPKAEISITYPDGKVIRRWIYGEKGKVIQASKEYCDVTIGDTSIKYIDGDYQLIFNDGDLQVKLQMKSTLPMYRPETGHVGFGDENLEYMGWFVAQPSSIITGTLTIDGKTQDLAGKGYHDHNWGNGFMLKQFNHWYWGRATVGEYTFITASMVATQIYGNSNVNIFMLGKNGEILDNDVSTSTLERKDTYQHEYTKKFMDNHLTFVQPTNSGVKYTIEYIREKDIVTDCLLSRTKLSAILQRILRFIGINPTYVRSLGKVILTIDDNGTKTVLEDEGLWEQMFFGNNKQVKIGR